MLCYKDDLNKLEYNLELLERTYKHPKYEHAYELKMCKFSLGLDQ